MIFFRVTQNINIKTTDGTMVSYSKFKLPSNIENETVYITTYDDFLDIEQVFSKVDKEKYLAKVLDEANIKKLRNFPVELGVYNNLEYQKRDRLKELDFFNLEKVDIYKQLKNIQKEEISIAFIGGVGKSISQIISSCTALRILYQKLKEIYKEIRFDIYINASSNSYYSRDKQLYLMQECINSVYPLSINLKKISQYDGFFDNSLDINSFSFDLSSVDRWLFKFGIDYEKIPENKKYNLLNLSKYTPQNSLTSKIVEAKKKGKIVLFHPYSANINKSIPQNIAIKLLKELLIKLEDYIIISTLAIDSKIKDDNYIDLSKDSKTIEDFVYIISFMDKIITTDTSTYHIGDAFMIPTIVIFTDEKFDRKIKYYKYTKPIFIKDKSKNLSKFIYENDNLTFNKFESWKRLKVNMIIKLLDSF